MPLILVVSNRGFLLLSAVSVTGGFDGIFERSAIGARGLSLRVWNPFLRGLAFLNGMGLLSDAYNRFPEVTPTIFKEIFCVQA